MAFLRSFGKYLPARRVTNAEIAASVGVDPEWILEMSGIRERRYAANDETVASMGLKAAEDCLQKAGISAADLGLILVASGSSERFCPGPASQIAAGLGLSATPALDLPVASAGSLIALAMAAQFAPRAGKILAVGVEIMSRRVDLTPAGKNTVILFGDGAGAALIDAEEGFARIADFSLSTDGNSSEVISIANGEFRMDGQAVILQAARKMPRAIHEILTRNQLTADGVECYLLHQANLNLIQRVANSVKVPLEKFYVNIDRYGNTSAASLLLAACEWKETRNGELNGPLVFSAFGAGINWGSLLALPA